MQAGTGLCDGIVIVDRRIEPNRSVYYGLSSVDKIAPGVDYAADVHRRTGLSSWISGSHAGTTLTFDLPVGYADQAFAERGVLYEWRCADQGISFDHISTDWSDESGITDHIEHLLNQTSVNRDSFSCPVVVIVESRLLKI